MSDDAFGFATIFLSSPAFSFTFSIPPLSTGGYYTSYNSPLETPTDIPASTPPFDTSFEISLPPPTLTQTGDPTITALFPTRGSLPLTSGDPTSLPLTMTDLSLPPPFPTDFSSVFTFQGSSIVIDPSSFQLSSPPPTSDPSVTSPKSFSFTFSSYLFSSTTTSLSSASSSSLTTSSSSLTSSSSFSSDSTSSASFPPPVTQTAFPTFGNGPDNTPQASTSSNHTGLIVAVSTGAIAFAIIVAVLAILCRKRHLKKARKRGTLDPFLDDLDGEMVAVNEPLLIIGHEPGTEGAVYSDPFTDESQPAAQSRDLSFTTGVTVGSTARRSNDSHEAVVGLNSTPTPELRPRGGLAGGYHNQPQPTNQLPPPQASATGTTPSRSPQSLPQVQTQFPPKFPVPRPPTPPFDPGAVAYLQYADRPVGRSLPSPEQQSPGNPEGHRLTSAFSVASEVSPQYSAHVPPLNIGEAWGSIPDPIKASSSYRPSIDRRQSFTPSFTGPAYDHGDTVVVAPLDLSLQGPAQCHTNPGSEEVWNPYDIRGGICGSRPSPIAEVTETLGHSQEASNDSWGTSVSSHVVMTAERLVLSPSYTVSPALSTGSFYEESVPSAGAPSQVPQLPRPPLPPLPHVQPLNLAKNRSLQS